jgi:hypothetical protein
VQRRKLAPLLFRGGKEQIIPIPNQDTMDGPETPSGGESSKPQSGDSQAQSTGEASDIETGDHRVQQQEEIVFQMKDDDDADHGMGGDDHLKQTVYKDELDAEETCPQQFVDFEGSLDVEEGASYCLKSSINSLSSAGLDDSGSRFSIGSMDSADCYDKTDKTEDDERQDSLGPLPKARTRRRRTALSEFKTAASGSTRSRDILVKSSLRICVTKGMDADGDGDGNGFRGQSAKVSLRFQCLEYRNGTVN